MAYKCLSPRNLATQAIELLLAIIPTLDATETSSCQTRLLSIKLRLPKGANAEQVMQNITSLRPDLKVHSKPSKDRFPIIVLEYRAEKVTSSYSNEAINHEEIARQCIVLLTSPPRSIIPKGVRLMSIKVQLPKGSDAEQVVQNITTLRKDLKAHTKESENEHPWIALGYKM